MLHRAGARQDAQCYTQEGIIIRIAGVPRTNRRLLTYDFLIRSARLVPEIS